jgi:phosphoglycolate phosphatase-like HAD superfamily hydrolase
MDYKAALFDLDMTLVDSSISEQYRKQREWSLVYSMIPQFKIHPDIHAMISEICHRGIVIAVVSSCPRPYCEKILSHYKFPFAALVSYHDTLLHKPSAQPFFKALSMIKTDPSLCVSLGDDVKDVIASKTCGIALNIGCTWHVDNSDEMRLNGADFIAREPLDVITYLDNR